MNSRLLFFLQNQFNTDIHHLESIFIQQNSESFQLMEKKVIYNLFELKCSQACSINFIDPSGGRHRVCYITKHFMILLNLATLF